MNGVKTVGSQEVRTTLFRQNALELRPQLKLQRHHVQGDIWVADRHQAGEFPPRLHHWHGTQCCGRTCPLRRIDQFPKVLGKPILPFSGGSRGNLKRDGVEAVVVTFHMPTDQRLEMISSGECHALRSLPVPPGRAPRITSHSGRTDTDRGLHSVLTILRTRAARTSYADGHPVQTLHDWANGTRRAGFARAFPLRSEGAPR